MTVQYVMLGIDRDYPDELHGLLDDYPLTSKKNHQRNVFSISTRNHERA